MKKSTMAQNSHTSLSKRLFTAMLLSGMLASALPKPSIAQDGETKEASSTTTSSTTTSTTTIINSQTQPSEQTGVPAQATATVTLVGEANLTQTPPGIEVVADQVVIAEGAKLGKYWLGLGLKKVEGDLATYLGSENGMLIFEIYPDSPAAKAEWKTGDILLSFNGKDVNDFETLLTEINQLETKSAKCVLLRRGEKIEQKIAPEIRPNDVPQIEEKGMSWTFEALPEGLMADADGKRAMILRAIPGEALKLFKVEGEELKLPEEALKAIPELEGALKKLKNIEVTQIGEGISVGVAASSDKTGEAAIDGKNISVTIVGKSGEKPGTYSVTIDGKKFEGSMDKIEAAPEKVQKALEHLKLGNKEVAVKNGITMTLSPKILGDKTQKEIEVILKKAEEASKKMEGTVTTTIVTDGKESDTRGIQKQIQVVVKDANEQGSETKKEKAQSDSKVTTKSRIIIASTDEKGEARVIELDGGNIANLSFDGGLKVYNGDFPKEILAKIEEAKKKVEAKKLGAVDQKSAAITAGKEKPSEAKEGQAKMQLRLQAVGADKSETLKREIEELRATINELKKQIGEMKK